MPGPMPRRSHRTRAPVPCSVSSAFPNWRVGRLPAFIREYDFSRVEFRGCRHFLMFRPPSLLASQIVPTAAVTRRAAETFTSGHQRASLPPHAPDMLAVRIQAIDGTRTFTALDSQSCRLLPPVARHVLVTVLPVTTPPEWQAASVSPRLVMLPSPHSSGLGLRSLIF